MMKQNDEIRAVLATKIKEIIVERKLTQTAASKMLGISQPRLSVILTGKKVSIESLTDCLSVLGHQVKFNIEKIA